ncbi:MAG: glycoside hydrolase family 5 protein [Nitrososphaeria archaeon]
MKKLTVEGENVLTDDGKTIRLKGVALGGHLNLEHFINGYSGSESMFRYAVASAIGEDKATFFFEKMIEYFMTEDDFRFLKSLGVNVIRLAINYRHFVNDKLLKTYRKMGFKFLDNVVELAKKNQIYVIIDMHSAPGWQNPSWHSDNIYQANMLWYSEKFQDETIRVWKDIVKRYKDEAIIAGYGLLNEPDAPSSSTLVNFYKKLIKSIRQYDTEHIIIPEANRYGRDPSTLETLDEDNLIVEVHYYPLPGFTDTPYPGEVEEIWGTKKEYYDKIKLEEEFLQRIKPILEWKRPIYVGEFGSIYWNTPNDIYRLRVNEDLLNIFEKYNAHWTIWTYKDIGIMGLMYLSPESEYMKRFSDLLKLKYKLGADEWGPSLASDFIKNMTKYFIEALKIKLEENGYKYEDSIINFEGEILDENWHSSYSYEVRVRRTFHILVSRYLVKLFAERLRGLDYNRLDKIAASFHFKNCLKRKALVEIIEKYCSL